MDKELKSFIEENIELIENSDFEELYKLANQRFIYHVEVGQLTEILLEANIHPERSLDKLPDHFLYSSKIKKN